jgi:hypothetical protein
MRINLKLTFVVSILLLAILSIHSCTKEKNVSDAEESTDKRLYDMSKSTTGFTWFKNTDVLLNKSTGSAHPQGFLRTRYNSIAATKLDAAGRIMNGVSFPEGSLIVKELFQNASTLDQYAILYKKSNSPDADANGWVWGYIKADGVIVQSASQKGNGCIGCHSQNGNIDYMLMNKYFP